MAILDHSLLCHISDSILGGSLPRGMYERLSPWVVGPTRTLLAKTCTKCDEFKQGCEFMLRTQTGKVKRSSWCVTCHYNQCKRNDKKSNALSLDSAINHHQRWTPSELDHLYVLRHVGDSRQEVAEILGRSIAAISVAYNRYFVEGADC